ncbi:MAG: hypothetical protein AB7E77_10855 [Desulfobulbus sp.]
MSATNCFGKAFTDVPRAQKQPTLSSRYDTFLSVYWAVLYVNLQKTIVNFCKSPNRQSHSGFKVSDQKNYDGRSRDFLRERKNHAAQKIENSNENPDY